MKLPPSWTSAKWKPRAAAHGTRSSSSVSWSGLKADTSREVAQCTFPCPSSSSLPSSCSCSYSDYSRRWDAAEREARRGIAEIDALEAKIERNIQTALERASPEQRREIKSLSDKGWLVSSWGDHDDRGKLFFYFDQGVFQGAFGST